MVKYIFTLLVTSSLIISQAIADKSCVRAVLKNGNVSLKARSVTGSKRCPKKFVTVFNTDTLSGVITPGPQGPKGDSGTNGINGTNGSDGANGNLRIYGDGSAGALSITTNTSWITSPPSDLNFQFTNCSVASGSTFTVPSGTVIRCNGTVQIDGAISVSASASGGARNGFSGTLLSTTNLDLTDYPPVQGYFSYSQAGSGQRGDNSIDRAGGSGSASYLSSTSNIGSSALLGTIGNIGIHGGGGGGTRAIGVGGTGGGVMKIYAKQAISISATGSISANGGSTSSCGGGGGGGVIILASLVSVTNAGTLSADGGDGGNAGTASSLGCGGGGGGGGGLIYFASPSITAGTTSVVGGAGGSSNGAVSSTIHTGGAGGGAGAGNGGSGGSIAAGSPSTANGGSNGEDGRVLQTVADPTAIL